MGLGRTRKGQARLGVGCGVEGGKPGRNTLEGNNCLGHRKEGRCWGVKTEGKRPVPEAVIGG